MASQFNDGDFILSHGEKYLTCPYSLAHVITNARLIVHLDKCRRNYIKMMKESGKTVDMRQCKFNFTHHVPSPEIDYHESRCPDQYSVVDHIRYHESDEFKSSLEEEKKRKEKEAEDLLERTRRGDIGHGRDPHRSSQTSSQRLPERDKKKQSKDKEVKPVVEENPWGSDTEDWEAESNGYECGYDPSAKLEEEIVLYHPRSMSKSERKTFRSEQKQKANNITYPEEIDVKSFSKLQLNESSEKIHRKNGSSSSSSSSNSKSSAPMKPMAVPPLPKPIVLKPEPVKWADDFKKEEAVDDEFYGEDPFA